MLRQEDLFYCLAGAAGTVSGLLLHVCSNGYTVPLSGTILKCLHGSYIL